MFGGNTPPSIWGLPHAPTNIAYGKAYKFVPISIGYYDSLWLEFCEYWCLYNYRFSVFPFFNPPEDFFERLFSFGYSTLSSCYDVEAFISNSLILSSLYGDWRSSILLSYRCLDLSCGIFSNPWVNKFGCLLWYLERTAWLLRESARSEFESKVLCYYYLNPDWSF
jgi:hypothetical protein